MFNAYEMLVVYSLKEASRLDSFKEETRKIFKENGFEISKEEEMGKKILAYPINKEKEGYYYLFYLKNSKEANYQDLHKQIKRRDFILRYLMLGVDESKIQKLKKKEEEFKNLKIEIRKKKMQKEQESKSNQSQENKVEENLN
ncbi:MAG: 30S ribosomal protein S6 [Spirochaetes bacterium]|nr:30S ribosomal protein S6 [Spirochaetota bacterium]